MFDNEILYVDEIYCFDIVYIFLGCYNERWYLYLVLYRCVVKVCLVSYLFTLSVLEPYLFVDVYVVIVMLKYYVCVHFVILFVSVNYVLYQPFVEPVQNYYCDLYSITFDDIDQYFDL